jgi:hypothetical protein
MESFAFRSLLRASAKLRNHCTASGALCFSLAAASLGQIFGVLLRPADGWAFSLRRSALERAGFLGWQHIFVHRCYRSWQQIATALTVLWTNLGEFSCER